MKITLELDDPAWAATVLRRSNSDTARTIVAQIEAQLSKPTPPEPEGYYLLQEPDGRVSVPVGGGVLNRLDDGARLYWDTLWAYHGSDMKIYRAEPWPDAVEALVDWLLASYANGRDDLEDLAREFARRLLGGDQ